MVEVCIVALATAEYGLMRMLACTYSWIAEPWVGFELHLPTFPYRIVFCHQLQGKRTHILLFPNDWESQYRYP
jgi:hypothetical protein